MKTVISNTIMIALVVFTMSACDFVNNANPAVSPNNGGNGDPNIIYKKVLVEDYTGHKCGNCPAAADTLTYLEEKYHGKIIPLAIHAGFFAYTNASYPTNFQTADGDAYDLTFGNSADGNPNGLVNRVGYPSGSTVFIKKYPTWEAHVLSAISQPANFQIKINNVFNTATNQLNTDVTVKSLGVNSGTYKLVLLLSEDSLIGEQLDYRIKVPPAPSQKINDYEFNHVLRGSINSTWGDAIFAGGAALNDSVVKTYSNFTINSSYNPAKCHVIAYVYDADATSTTHYEILQAEEAKVK